MHRFRSRGLLLRDWFVPVVAGGVVGLVRDSGPQYQGLAVGVLCLGFVVYVWSQLRREPAQAPAVAEVDGPTDGGEPELCDFCDRAEPKTVLGVGYDLPEGWLSLEIARRGMVVLPLTYCSVEHMRLALAEPLPATEPWDSGRPPGSRSTGWAWILGLCLLAALLFLCCAVMARSLVTP